MLSAYKRRKLCQRKQEQITITNNNITNNTINNNKYIVNFSDNQDFFKLLSQEQKVQIIEQLKNKKL